MCNYSLRSVLFDLGRYLALLIACGTTALAGTAPDMKFDVLQIGTETLSNVTVTTTNKDYVFLLHSKGMANYKVANLPPDVLKKLGYFVEDPASQTNSVVNWAKGNVTEFTPERMQEVEETLLTKLPPALPGLIKQHWQIASGVAGGLLLVHLFFCYCFMVLCRKTGVPAGFLVWIPILQLIPLVRAARMSPFWAIIFLLPVLNIVAQIVWSFKISKARGFGAGLGFLLLLPIINFFAFLYLTFAGNQGSISDRQPKRRTEMMTLETA